VILHMPARQNRDQTIFSGCGFARVHFLQEDNRQYLSGWMMEKKENG